MILSALLTLCSAQVVRPNLGIDSVKQWAGYFDVTHGSTFFYMFEARNDPCNAPVIFWFNGGPGGSSMPAILSENGPSWIKSDGSLVKNSNSWNEFANMVYIDNPVGTGFSISTDPNLGYTADAAVDFLDFVVQFYDYFPTLKSSPLHLAGESYAGVYIPTFGEALVKNGTKSLASIMIGNGQVSYGDAILATPDFYCGKSRGSTRILTDQNCTAMYNSLPACSSAVSSCEAAAATGDYDACDQTMDSCGAIFNAPTWFYRKGGNPYNTKKTCEPTDFNVCYSIIEQAAEYFNESSTKQALGIDPNFDYEASSSLVSGNWDTREGFGSIPDKVAYLLNHGVRVLAYNGDLDGMIPFDSATKWTSDLEWYGKSGFNFARNIIAKLHFANVWLVGTKPLGSLTSYGPLTLLRVWNAGHMVPLDAPATAFAMAKSWVKGGISAVRMRQNFYF